MVMIVCLLSWLQLWDDKDVKAKLNKMNSKVRNIDFILAHVPLRCFYSYHGGTSMFMWLSILCSSC